jgi:transcriptional regulator with XRE-family HTH domain
MTHVFDADSGLTGGPAFGAALAALAAEKGFSLDDLAAACGRERDGLVAVVNGTERVPPAALARLARALRLRPIEFMQKTGLLSLDVYAAGLDPLFFLPAGQIRHDARIYMREINPRHAVPEGDMTKRSPVLRAVAEDDLLDARAKLEIEFTYLLHTAAAAAGGRL